MDTDGVSEVLVRSLASEREADHPDVSALSKLNLAELLERMTPARQRAVFNVLTYLTGPADSRTIGSVVETLCGLVVDAGVPLDRYGSSTTMVTSEHDAIGRIWRRDKGVEQSVYVNHETAADPVYLASPFFLAAQTREWVEAWLPDTPDERFGIVPTLKAQGFVHYLCMPFTLSNGADGWTTFATKHPAGFSEQDVLVIAFLLPPLICRIDSRVGWATLDTLLRTYVGDEPHTAILAGRAKRGQVTTIEAAMLVDDLRDSTGHTADLSAVEAVDLFNELFDCLVPAIDARRGEVLKYLGDGLLAMFREVDGGGTAPDRALETAEAALQAVTRRNADAPHRRPMEIGIALHFGEIAYGNVGSGSRLDFTVIGRDVALATRIAGMNAKLGQPLLLSAGFARRLSRGAERIGLFPARGFEEPIEVFRPLPTGPGDGPAGLSEAAGS